MTIGEAAAQLRARQASSVELVEQSLRAIGQLQPRLNAFLTVTGDSARAAARRLDAELAEGRDRGPLHGIPVAYKDLVCTRGVKTTAGSLIHRDYVPDFDATVVQRLEAAGAISLGKLNLHEHAYGITSNNPHYGAVRNPWDPERIPGGSSGGSAAAVASGQVFMAVGTDTGGSIRCPASFCGIAGLKPTYGLVSRYGVIPLGWSLDHIGPMARTVSDLALSLAAMAGHDPQDPGSTRRKPPSYALPVQPTLSGLRLGWPENFYFDRLQSPVRRALEEMAEAARTLGAEIVPLRVPDIGQLNTAARIILLAEAAAVHEPHEARRAEYGPDVRALLDQGRLISATDYLHAQRARARFCREFCSLFRRIDILLAPATPSTAPLIGQDALEIGGSPEDVRIATTRLLRGINALGLPALALPAGFDPQGLPIGMQMIGPAFSEARLLRAGAALESAMGFASARPPHHSL